MWSNNLTEVFRTRTFPANTKVCRAGSQCQLLASLSALASSQRAFDASFCVPQHILGFNEPNDPCGPC